MTRRDAEAMVACLDLGGLVVDPQSTIEHAVGWAVFVNTPTFVRTRDFGDSQIGLGAYIVTRDGELFASGSRNPVEISLEDVAAMTGRASLAARLRHRWRKLTGGVVVTPIPAP